MEFPNDILLKIISYMDIDTRRSLGIFTKLHIPQKIKNTLTSLIPHPTRLIFEPYSRVSLGPIRKSITSNESDRFMYVLHNDFGYSNPDKITGNITSCYSHGINWYLPCILDKKANLKCPLVISKVEQMSKKGIMMYHIIWNSES